MSGITADRRVTAADIAREVGVSRTTVGFVLNETPGQSISPSTTQRVLEVAARLGYRPHLAARALARGQSKIILLVLPDWPVEYSMRRHIDEASMTLDEAGYSLVTMTAHSGGGARPLWESLQPDVVIGLMPFTRQQYERIRAAGVTTVIPEPDDEFDTGENLLSYSQGSRLQVEHLIDRGHRRVIYAAPRDPRLKELVSARYAVAADTARTHGIELDDPCPVDAAQAIEITRNWHSAGITGVVTFNDEMAALIVGAAIRAGLRVSDDLAVVGHDDSPLATLFVPSITSVQVDETGLGRYVAELALAAATGSPEPIQEPALHATLIPRESTSPFGPGSRPFGIGPE